MDAQLGNLIIGKLFVRKRIDYFPREGAETSPFHFGGRHNRKHGGSPDNPQAIIAAEYSQLAGNQSSHADSKLIALKFRQLLSYGIEKIAGIEIIIAMI